MCVCVYVHLFLIMLYIGCKIISNVFLKINDDFFFFRTSASCIAC